MDTLDFTNIYDRLKPRRQKVERIDAYTESALNFVASIIDIKNFNEATGLDQKIFQMVKLSEGMVGLAKEGEEYVMCSVKQKGLPRKDWKPEVVTAEYWHNQQLYVKELKNDKDVVILYNTPILNDETDIFRAASAMSNTDNSFNLLVKYTRYLPLLLARNNKEREILIKAIQAMDRGENTVVTSEDITLDEVLEQKREMLINLTDPQLSDKIQYIMEASDNVLRRFYNKFGLYTSGNAKHAQQSKMEIDNGESAAWVYPLLYLKETDDFCRRANELFGLDLDATFGDLHSLLWQKFILQHEPTSSEPIKVDNVSEIVDNASEEQVADGDEEREEEANEV